MIYTPRTCIIPAAAVPSPAGRLRERKSGREREGEGGGGAVAVQAPLPAEVQSNFNGNCRHFMRCEMILLHHYVQRRQKKKRSSLSLPLFRSLSLPLAHTCMLAPVDSYPVNCLRSCLPFSLSAQNHNCCAAVAAVVADFATALHVDI